MVFCSCSDFPPILCCIDMQIFTLAPSPVSWFYLIPNRCDDVLKLFSLGNDCTIPPPLLHSSSSPTYPPFLRPSPRPSHWSKKRVGVYIPSSFRRSPFHAKDSLTRPLLLASGSCSVFLELLRTLPQCQIRNTVNLLLKNSIRRLQNRKPILFRSRMWRLLAFFFRSGGKEEGRGMGS